MNIIDLRDNKDHDTFMIGDLKPCFEYMINKKYQKRGKYKFLFFVFIILYWSFKISIKIKRNGKHFFSICYPLNEKNIIHMLMLGFSEKDLNYFNKSGISFEYRKNEKREDKICGVVK